MRDLQWRRRRFVIAVIGTSLVFAVTLLIGGLANSFRSEARRTVEALGIDGWVVNKGIVGPFTGISLVDTSRVAEIAKIDGVRAADPIAISPQAARPFSASTQVWGHRPGGLGSPPISKGRGARASGEAVADEQLDARIGSTVRIGDTPFRVVGLTEGLTLFGGRASLYLPLRDVQRLALNGLPLATAIGIRGTAASAPPGMHVVTPDELRIDLLEPVKNAIGAIDTIRVLLWIVAGSIVGAVVYLSALERMRDFAVFKATGASTSMLAAGLIVQAGLLSVVSAALSAGIARLLVPVFPMSVELPVGSVFVLVGVALVIGALASLFAARRATSVDPATAFGGP